MPPAPGPLQVSIVLGLASLAYALYRGVKQWGASFLWILAAGVSFLNSAGVLAELLWGPRWSWTFTLHGPESACATLFQGICFLVYGLYLRKNRQNVQIPPTPASLQ